MLILLLLRRLISCQHKRFFCVICLIFLILFYLSSKKDALIELPRTMEFTVAEKIQLGRKNLIKEKCQEVRLARKPRKHSSPVRLTVLDGLQLINCEVPKVASTNLNKLMLVLAGLVKTDALDKIPRILAHEGNPIRKLYVNNLTDTNRHGLSHFTKFMFVRHPFERLVSAYLSKFTKNNIFYQKSIGKIIVKKYRKQPSQLSLQNGDDVTFPEFVNFILDEWKDDREVLDAHWRPITDVCLPCIMEYDVIGRFETLSEDVGYLLQRLDEGRHKRLFTFKQPKSTWSLWKKFMANLSRQHLSDLNSMFSDDFKIFGYSQYTDDHEHRLNK